MGSKAGNRCDIVIGTSGYSYSEWLDAGFYPPGTAARDMLAVYASRFPVTELNYTWYQMPRAPAIDRMCRQVPGHFRFAVKLTRTMTHEVKPDQWRNEAASYRQGISPLVESGQLLAVLIQLPPFFVRTPGYRHYLAALLDELAGLPLAVEFRHDSWASDRVLAELERRRVTLVAVDEPKLPNLFPRLEAVTNPELFYVRFHGRNARGWTSGNMQKQFDYMYSREELQEWISSMITPMAARAGRGAVFFNNHVRGQAPANARTFMELLADGKPMEKQVWNEPLSI